MIVIADDITGAAEIAGIAFSQGLQVRLCVGCGSVAASGFTVIATDTRSMTAAAAIAETRHIAYRLSPITHHPSPITPHLFKKTDSALRGHVVAELSALMEATGYRRAVYLPANPSKGRVIRSGVYYINNIPIADTDFSFDPEFPAKTSVLKERFPDAGRHHIIMPDAESEDDIRQVVAAYNDGHTLFAGAADLFSVILASLSHVGAGPAPAQTLISAFAADHPAGAGPTPTLIVCGSTQSKTPDIGIAVAPMPCQLYDGSTDIILWDTSAYTRTQSIILTIPYHHRTGKDCAEHLRAVTARKVKSLMEQHLPARLVIEGGATAWAILQSLGWTSFEVIRQIAPGVVQLRSDNGVLVTLKPGSYPWGII